MVLGREIKNIEVQGSLSINSSFGRQEVNTNGKLEPSAGKNIVDMGLRVLIPSYTSINYLLMY